MSPELFKKNEVDATRRKKLTSKSPKSLEH
jgi:hypothetical protein